jgi:hypothetical protein
MLQETGFDSVARCMVHADAGCSNRNPEARLIGDRTAVGNAREFSDSLCTPRFRARLGWRPLAARLNQCNKHLSRIALQKLRRRRRLGRGGEGGSGAAGQSCVTAFSRRWAARGRRSLATANLSACRKRRGIGVGGLRLQVACSPMPGCSAVTLQPTQQMRRTSSRKAAFQPE